MIGAVAKEFLEAGCALIVGTVDDEGMPHASRAWGLDVLDPAEGRVRIILPGDDPVTMRNLRATGRVAVTGTDILTLRSMQAKGRVLCVEDATVVDRHRATRFCDALFGDIQLADGVPRAMSGRLAPRSYRACVAVIDQLYDQTPGPKAGSRVTGTAP